MAKKVHSGERPTSEAQRLLVRRKSGALKGRPAVPQPVEIGNQIPALTGVRALAAFLVFFHHNRTKFLEVGPLLLWWELHIGVTLFFVLSGFMITWRYDRRGPPRGSYLRNYFVNRFARIYPLYFVLAALTLLLCAERSPRVWFLNLTIFSTMRSGIPQAWSLRVEECFYLSAPLIFLAWKRHPLLPLGIAAVVLATMYPIATLPAAQEVIGSTRDLLLYSFPGRFFEFYVGIALARRVMATGPNRPEKVRFPLRTFVGASGIAAAVGVLAGIHAAAPQAYMYGLWHPAGIALNNLVLPLFIATFYRGLIGERSLLQRLLSTRFADLLGKSSYAFYLIHIGILRDYLLGVLILVAGFFGPRAASTVTSVTHHVSGLFVIVSLLSIALYKTIEAPANRFLRRRFASPRGAPP